MPFPRFFPEHGQKKFPGWVRGYSYTPRPGSINLNACVFFLIIPSLGRAIQLRWTVHNSGTGVTAKSSWSDGIYWSSDNITSADDRLLTTRRNNGRLMPNGERNVIANVEVPRKIYGNFFIYVKTDIYNEIFEYVSDGNNIGFSVSKNVIFVSFCSQTLYTLTDSNTLKREGKREAESQGNNQKIVEKSVFLSF